MGEDGHVRVRTYTRSQDGKDVPKDNVYNLLAADASFDMWSLGCVLYQLSTGTSLFQANDEDNIQDQDLVKLALWKDELKKAKLARVGNRYARHLLQQLLQKDPQKRPSAQQVLAEDPFVRDEHIPGRLPGEAPLFDVFLSYRVKVSELQFQGVSPVGSTKYNLFLFLFFNPRLAHLL
jgi:serine/threonine protein kinase